MHIQSHSTNRICRTIKKTHEENKATDTAGNDESTFVLTILEKNQRKNFLKEV